MVIKKIDGQIRRIESKSKPTVFFDFEFWADSDENTYGLLCLVQVSEPTNLFITEMNANELAISDGGQGLEAVKNRVTAVTGVKDLVFPKVIRFDEKENNITAGFQAFLKTYEKPVPVYENIIDNGEEAMQVEKLSIEQFKKLGGKVTLLGNLTV